MYLKSIEVQGFKSFANKIIFDFHNGITGIVGPNGSGKSNVADAVRWVLGEQSAKSLRGGNMQDVIFSGAENRKPLGYAFVAITLDNADHVLPVSYDTVTVSRRLYRSGESEYMINGVQCRLKDVNELFYDTGIGREGYSIIGQGQVEQILNGKPEERRALFDEAAGIVKYKRRKIQTQKKLEDEQANLIRVNDILSELTRQIGPLERQSEKAKIYLKRREELKDYEVNQFLEDFQELKDRIDQAQQNFDNASAQLEGEKQESEQLKTAYEETQARIEEMDARRSELQRTANEQSMKNANLINEINLLTEKIRAAKENAGSLAERLENLEADIRRKQAELEKIRQDAKDLADSAKELESVGRILSEDHRKLQMRINAAGETSEQHSAALMKVMEKKTQLQGEVERSTALLEQVKIRRASLDAQVLALRSEKKDQSSEADRLEKLVEEIKSEIAILTSRSEAADTQQKDYTDKITAKSAQYERDQQEYHRAASRLESMRNIAERYDGYGNSIRRIMEQKKNEPGLLGVVADLIRTDKKYETAIETALGGSIQNIVTDTEDTAKRMIEFLKRNKFGRATFLPLTAMNHSSELKNEAALRERGVIGLASTLVEADKRYDGLVRYLLGRTVVCDNIDNAVALARKYKYSLRIVTLEGESLNAGGSMTGGAFKNASNLLGRRREIEELEKITAQKADALDELKDEIDMARTSRNRIRMMLQKISEELQQKYLAQNTAQIELKEAIKRRDDADKSYEVIYADKEKLVTEAQEFEKTRDEAADKLQEAVDEETILRSRSETTSDELEGLREEERKQQEELEKNHLEIAAAKQNAVYQSQEINRLGKEITDLQEECKLIRDSRSQSGADIGLKEKQIEELQLQADEAKKNADAAQSQLDSLAAERETENASLKKLFARREELTSSISLLDKECFRLNNSIERLTEHRENTIAHMWEEYELTYSSALALKRDDLGNKADWKKQISRIRGQIKELGSVNVNAIEEFKEVSERHTFLSAQHDDLIKAEKDLEKIIAELDKGMRAQFEEQFGRIKVEFDKSFKALFGGGQGALELVENEDILDAGVRIIAQPPGKKLVNMMQMSGGEKALTAIALLFAIQNLKPSPFCLLDEIEAALDENNVDRYAQYLHKLTKYTQFIIITHRRGTMAAADRLYGITMQEKGISTLVSVNLIENELDS